MQVCQCCIPQRFKIDPDHLKATLQFHAQRACGRQTAFLCCVRSATPFGGLFVPLCPCPVGLITGVDLINGAASGQAKTIAALNECAKQYKYNNHSLRLMPKLIKVSDAFSTSARTQAMHHPDNVTCAVDLTRNPRTHALALAHLSCCRSYASQLFTAKPNLLLTGDELSQLIHNKDAARVCCCRPRTL